MVKIKRKVWKRKAGKVTQHLVTIPSKADIKEGDWVCIEKIKDIKL